MIEFKDAVLKDRQWAVELLSYSGYRGCEYTFGNNYIWQNVFGTQIARYKDFYLIKSGGGGYFFPAGKGDFREAVEVLRKDAQSNGKPLYFITMNKRSRNWLEENYPDNFDFSTDRGFYDYIYDYCDLVELAGRKYHSKRNFINRFNMLTNNCYEPITPKNISECIEMNEKWFIEYSSCNNEGGRSVRSLEDENCVVRKGLENFEALGFTGGLLRVCGDVVAFTFGERGTDDTFVVHAEKAFTRIPGAYPSMNNCFVKNELCGYKYINREEDMGLENLRKAKLSYHPAFLEEKYRAKERI